MSPIAPYSTFHISFSAVLPFMLLARGLPDALGLSSSSPSLSVSDNWASSSLELWELPHFSSDSDCSSLLLSSARQLLVLRRVLDKRITWSFSHSFLNRWTGPEIKTKIIDTLLPEARWYALYKNINSTRYSYETYSYKKRVCLMARRHLPRTKSTRKWDKSSHEIILS